MPDADTICEVVEFAGPRGTLNGRLTYCEPEREETAAPGSPPRPGGVLVLSPHPFMGGHMDLPLLTAIADHTAALGIPTLRFDYGGVGRSEGPPFDIGEAMDMFWKTGTAPQDPVLIEEALCARDWFTRQVHRPVVLVGYSFGSFVATRVCDRTTPGLVLIAPTINHHDYSGFSNADVPTLIVAGEGDFATDDSALAEWAGALPGPTRVEQIAGADHFFRDSNDEVGALVAGFLAEFPAGTPASQGERALP